MTKCFECGEKLYADQEWKLRPDLNPNKDATGNDFIHKDCFEDYIENLEYNGGKE